MGRKAFLPLFLPLLDVDQVCGRACGLGENGSRAKRPIAAVWIYSNLQG